MGYQMVNGEMFSNLRPDNLESEIWMLGKYFHLGRKATMKATRWKRRFRSWKSNLLPLFNH